MDIKSTAHYTGILYLICLPFFIHSGPLTTTYHIKVDQFGYLPSSKKVAVVADPLVGFNAAEAFSPGTGVNQYQVRRWDNDVVVYTGTITAWQSGATHTQSGDRGWWFDFSSLVTAGSYYIYDVTNNIGSFRFDINNNVYDEVLKQAMRMYFYQRINFAKQAPYTDAKWTDGACFEGATQDKAATSRFAKGDLSTAKDLRGGWMDAGDKNKYTTFAASAVIQLAEAYRINPAVFKDNYNIPESGNGIPDILDELKYELDFLKRMQDATGTNGFLLKVGNDNYNEINPPSADTRPRYYLPECTAGTISGMAMFAVAGAALKSVSALNGYALDLIARAETAWARAKITTSNFTSFQLDCDDGDIKSGDADNNAEEQFGQVFVAAVYLYEHTGNAEYKSFAEANYINVNPYKINWWGPYWIPQQLALLRLTTLPGISTGVVTNIRNQKASMNYLYSINDYNAGTDLYRSHMGDDTYHWGHNQTHTNAGNQNLDYISFNLNASNHALYKETAEQYLHWMHGTNPLGMVMLSNMYAYGAEKSVNDIYHTWFNDGTSWDNALTSTNGPAPGYVTGGPNKNYSGTVSGITSQPPQKAYKDWNTGYPENSWEITEPAIYSQASYVMLLARLMTVSAGDIQAPTVPANLAITNINTNSISLSWSASTDNVGVAAYELYQDNALINANITNTTFQVTGLNCATAYSYFVKAKDAVGNISGPSNTVTGITNTCTLLTNKIIYADALSSEWVDVSINSTRNYNNTNPVQSGSKSLSVDYASNGILSFSKSTAATTTTNTQLRFWVYNNGNSSIRISTQSADNSGNSLEITTRPAKRRWVEIIINLSQLGTPSSIKRVLVKNAN
ncbi:MAG: glycoside hydrolase family 9 protein, partial [Saprospiraceae bacterium]